MSSQIKDFTEQDSGPSVDSTDIEERIAARRLRIGRRIEALKKYEFDYKNLYSINTNIY